MESTPDGSPLGFVLVIASGARARVSDETGCITCKDAHGPALRERKQCSQVHVRSQKYGLGSQS
eukprot:3382586-Amphidinium_carterae.1